MRSWGAANRGIEETISWTIGCERQFLAVDFHDGEGLFHRKFLKRWRDGEGATFCLKEEDDDDDDDDDPHCSTQLFPSRLASLTGTKTNASTVSWTF